jgi:short-subunit dehydrogenase
MMNREHDTIEWATRLAREKGWNVRLPYGTGDSDLDHRMRETALVSGASGGIGEDLARLLAEDGRDVVLLARNSHRLQELANELTRAHTITATVLTTDLSEPGAADHVARELAERRLTIDILVNNAGFGTLGEFARESPREQEQMLPVNVVALTALTRRVLPGMLDRRKGRILNVVSTAAFQPGPLMAVYNASKAYLLLLSMALTEETAGTGVTVTCLCPGPTRTGFQQRAHMEKARLLDVASVMSSTDVARAGYVGMTAGRPLVIPGLMNKLSTHASRFTTRRVPAKRQGLERRALSARAAIQARHRVRRYALQRLASRSSDSRIHQTNG